MKTSSCSGIRLKNLLRAAVQRLEFYARTIEPTTHLMADLALLDRGYVNDLHAALDSALRSANTVEHHHAGKILQEFSQTLSRTAKGNAGIIMGIVFTAFVDPLRAKNRFTAVDVVVGFENSVRSIKSLSWQEENNKLLSTVLDCYHVAIEQLNRHSDLYTMLTTLHETIRARFAARKPEELLLDFINTGEWALLGIVEGMRYYSQRKKMDDPIIDFSLNTSERLKIASITGKYAVELTLNARSIPVEKVKKSLADLSEFMVLIPLKDTALRVYLYTYDTKRVFDRISQYGKLETVRVADIVGVGETSFFTIQA